MFSRTVGSSATSHLLDSGPDMFDRALPGRTGLQARGRSSEADRSGSSVSLLPEQRTIDGAISGGGHILGSFWGNDAPIPEYCTIFGS